MCAKKRQQKRKKIKKETKKVKKSIVMKFFIGIRVS